MKTRWMSAVALAALLGGGACATTEDDGGGGDDGAPAREGTTSEATRTPSGSEIDDAEELMARATLVDRNGNEVGTVTFTEHAEGVRVHAEVHDVPPGPHGLHAHENGDCSADDFSSAGGHFDPTNERHGAPASDVHHAGDFGNITVNEDGTGELTLESGRLSVGPGARSIVGRAVILHEGTDDLTSQPSGAAGPRLACGVVERLSDEEMARIVAEPSGTDLRY